MTLDVGLAGLAPLAYHIQERAEGGLSKATRRCLAKFTGLNGENRTNLCANNFFFPTRNPSGPYFGH